MRQEGGRGVGQERREGVRQAGGRAVGQKRRDGGEAGNKEVRYLSRRNYIKIWNN